MANRITGPRRSKRVAAMTLATGSLTFGLCPASTPGAVVGNREGPCPDEQRRVWFEPASWSPTAKGAFLNGANSTWGSLNPEPWEPTNDRAGLSSGAALPISVLEAREFADPHDIEAYRADLPENVLGFTQCVGGTLATILLAEELPVEPADPDRGATVDFTAAHEVGHTLGLAHVGHRPEHTSRAIMSTCLWGSRNPTISPLDAAQYFAGEEPGTPSLAFDPSLRDVRRSSWQMQGAVAADVVTHSGRDGVVLLGPAYGRRAGISQTMETWGLGGRSFRAGARYKKATAQDAELSIAVEYRQLTVPAATQGCEVDQFINGLDLNAHRSYGPWKACETRAVPVENASFRPGQPYSMGSECGYPASWQGAEFRTTIWKGTDASVFLDEVILREARP